MRMEMKLSFHAASFAWHGILFPGPVSSVTNQLLVLIVITQLSPIPHTLSYSFSPDPHGISYLFCTYYLPLPDLAAWFSSDRFHFSECRLSKTNIMAHGSQDYSPMSKCPMPKKTVPENTVLPLAHRCISVNWVACVKKKVQGITSIFFLYQWFYNFSCRWRNFL